MESSGSRNVAPRTEAGTRRGRAGGMWRLVALLIVSMMIAASCGDDGSNDVDAGGGDGNGDGGEPIVFGAVIAHTGAAGAFGPSVELGLRTAVADINAAGGLLGRQIEMVVRDSATETDRGVLAAQDLLDNENVDIMFPDYPANTLGAILPLTTEQEMLTVTQGSCSCAGDSDQFPYSYQITVPKPADVLGIIDGIERLQEDGVVGGDRVARFTFEDAAAAEFDPAVEEFVPAAGYELVGTAGVPTTATDYTVELERLRETDPDVIITHPSGGAIVTLMNGLRDIGWTDIPVISDTAAQTVELQQQIPPSVAENLYILTLRAATREGAGEPDTPFMQRLEENGTIDNMTVSSMSHDVFRWLAWGIERAGTLDGNDVTSTIESDMPGLDESEWPEGLALGFNPGWNEDSHTVTIEALEEVYALGVVSENVKGTIEKYTDVVLPLDVAS